MSLRARVTVVGTPDAASNLSIDSASIPACNNFVITHGRCGRMLVTPATVRKRAASGQTIFQAASGPNALFKAIIPAPVRAKLSRVAAPHPYETYSKRFKPAPVPVQELYFVAEPAPFDVVCLFGDKDRFAVFPRDFREYQVVDGTVHCAAPDPASWHDTPTSPVSIVVPAPPPITLACLLSSSYDGQDPMEDSEAGRLMLRVYMFAGALFAETWALFFKKDRLPHPVPRNFVQAYIDTKEPAHLRAAAVFVTSLFAPIQLTACHIRQLIPVFMPNAGMPSLVPDGKRQELELAGFIRFPGEDMHDSLLMFDDCFSLPLAEFVCSRRYTMIQGRLYAWASQLLSFFQKELAADSGSHDRAVAKIVNFIHNSLAMDTTRTLKTRHLTSIETEYLTCPDRNPGLAEITRFYMRCRLDDDPTSKRDIIVRMKHCISVVLAGVTDAWEYGVIHDERTKDGYVRVSIRVNKLPHCIVPGCHPHSRSHMFVIAFTHDRGQDTWVRFCTNAIGAHPAKNGKRYGLLATACISGDAIADKFRVFFQ